MAESAIGQKVIEGYLNVKDYIMEEMKIIHKIFENLFSF